MNAVGITKGLQMAMFAKKSLIGATMLALLSTTAMAQDVTLRSHDGNFTLSGELLGYENGEYSLKSVFGTVNIRADEVECIGAVCANFVTEDREFGIAGLEILTKSLLPSLLIEYGGVVGYQVSIGAGVTGGTQIDFLDETNAMEASITVTGSGTVGGYAALAAKEASIVLAGRPPNAVEVTAIAVSGQGDLSKSRRQEVIAMEALIILVADENPVRSLTVQQVNDIFTGKITNWSQIGSNDAQINVYRRRDEDAITNVLRNDVFTDRTARFPAGSITIADEDSLSDVVAGDPNGIGFSHFSEIANSRALAVRGSCGILASPTEFNIKSEEYPFSHRLYAFVPDGALPHVAQGFMDYVVTDAAQEAVERAGFISGTVQTATADEQGYRFANAILASQDEVGLRALLTMTEELIDAERLSTTLRFETSSSRLDVRAETDIIRLLDQLARKDFSSREIMLVGFTDSVGSSVVNAGLGKKRADQVLARIRELAPEGLLDNLTFTTVGRGEVSPIACNDSQHGRFMNRRVEIWIRNKV